jgi:glycosyltransferase involved in cell wall biosynthesis
MIAPVGAVVHTYHGIHYLHSDSTLKKTLYKLVDHLMLRLTDRLICVSERDFGLGVQAGVVDPNRTVVIRNGIDIGRYKYHGSRRPRDQKVVGTIGRLHLQKGHIYLLEAARSVLQEYPSVIFQIIGSGELERELRNKARDSGIAQHVDFLGARTDIPELLSNMDLFVLPSLWEGLPITLLEAMASHTPIIATDIDGVSEVIEHNRDGLLVPARSPDHLADAIKLLLNDSSLAERLSQHAFDKVTQKFDIRKMVRLIEGVYEAMATHNRP